MTDSTKFKLLAAFRFLKQKIAMSSFDDRLALQKKVYLLQELGLNLGNSYGWYLRGPYSRDVANDGFYLEKVQNEITELEELSEQERVAVGTFNSLIEEAKTGLGKNDLYCLELLASLHFVLKYGYPKPPSKQLAIFQLTYQKTKFDVKDGEVAMKLLEKYGLDG
jgi:uncharacterized protein YwgA